MTNSKLFEIFFILSCMWSPSYPIILSQYIKPTDNYDLGVKDQEHVYPLLVERQLLDDIIRLKKHDYKTKSNPGQRKLKLLKIASMIQRKAKKRGRDIRKVTLGDHVKSILGYSDIKSHLSRYLQDKHLKQKIRKLKHKFNHKNLSTIHRKSDLSPALMNLPRPSIHPSKRRLQEELAQFNYLPGPAGPFGGIPPMMMSPIHMHPPLNITVNRIPDKSFANKMQPLVLQTIDLNNHLEQLDKLKKELESTLIRADGFHDDVKKTLEADVKYIKKMTK